METLERRLVVGPLRRRSDWLPALQDMLDDLSKTLGLADKDSEALHGLPDLVLFPVYAQLISHMDFAFDDICFRIRFIYSPGEDDEDNLDITPLKLASWEIERMDLQIFVSDEDYADYLGADRVLALSSGRLQVKLVPLDREADVDSGEGAAPSCSEGNEPHKREVPEKQSRSSDAHKDLEADTDVQDSSKCSHEQGEQVGDNAEDVTHESTQELTDKEERPWRRWFRRKLTSESML